MRPRDRRAVWNIPGRVDKEFGEGPGRLLRRAQGAFRPLQAAPGHPTPVHEEFCGDCQQEAGYNVLRGHSSPVPPGAATAIYTDMTRTRNAISKDTKLAKVIQHFGFELIMPTLCLSKIL